jgi:hypothetical protein
LLINLQQLLDDPQLTYKETLQVLWSGYGEITRYYSPVLKASVIVKSVCPPQKVDHPRGWHSEAGHQRKLASYKIEANFYKSYALHCPNACYVPQVIAFSESLTCSQANLPDTLRDTLQDNTESQILVMEDLKYLGFDDKESILSLTDIKAVICWLANFHGHFMGHQAIDLWPVGTYWYLETRQDEFNSMADGPLKQAAHFIDSKLNNARYQTIVHGDAKLANFCFGGITTNSGQNNEIDDDLTNKLTKKIRCVAAVDFQYVGKGVGVKDLAYFLGSCLTDNDLTKLHNELLDYYFKELRLACIEYQQNINYSELEKEWRKLYSFSNADFHRFLQGWSPEHHKINGYLQAQSDLALQYCP